MAVNSDNSAILRGAAQVNGHPRPAANRAPQGLVRHEANDIMYLTFSKKESHRGSLTRQLVLDFFVSVFGANVIERVQLNSSPNPKHGWLFLREAEYAQTVLGPKHAPRKFRVPPHGRSVWVKPHDHSYPVPPDTVIEPPD